MGRKRKMITTGVVPIGGPRLKSRREARKVTSQFHKLQNEIGEILNATDDANDSDTPTQNRSALSSNKKQQLYVLEKSIEAMGGRDRYQQASVVTTSHHSTSKWVVSVLNKLGVYPRGKNARRLKTLEVGAINTQLQRYPGLAVRAIDINSQHALIEEQDFFDILPTASHDVIVCSMVVNCVDTPLRRGEMLLRLSAQLKLNSGILFLVLPTKCINNEFLSHKQFLQYLKAVSLVLPTTQDPVFNGLFPNCTAEAPLEEYCSRLTPKLSFFVLVHQPAQSPALLACSVDTAGNAQKVEQKTCEEEWFRDERFHHILRTIRMADHAGLLGRFKCSEQSQQQKKINKLSSANAHRTTLAGRFNSSEFSVSLPLMVLRAATDIVSVRSRKTERGGEKRGAQ